MTFSSGMILPPQPIAITVDLAPAYNVLNSMAMVLNTEENAGVDNWLARRGLALPPDLAERHEVIFNGFGVEGLCMAVEANPVPDFLTYVDLLAAQDPVSLRDRLFHHALTSVHRRAILDMPNIRPADPAYLLSNLDAYLKFVEEEYIAPYDKTAMDQVRHLAVQAHALMNDPPRMQATIVAHLRLFWEDYFLPEWEAVQPNLQETTRVLSGLQIDHLPRYEAIQAITGRNLRGIFDDDELDTFERIVFVPSKHNGPYVSWFGDEQTLWVIFGARMPTHTGDPTLDTDELLNRLNALGDKTRLDILVAIRRQGELSTGRIMELFDLNKSAASRHLRQLRANELIVERRDVDNKTKFYSLQDETIAAVLKTIERLLG